MSETPPTPEQILESIRKDLIKMYYKVEQKDHTPPLVSSAR